MGRIKSDTGPLQLKERLNNWEKRASMWSTQESNQNLILEPSLTTRQVKGVKECHIRNRFLGVTRSNDRVIGAPPILTYTKLLVKLSVRHLDAGTFRKAYDMIWRASALKMFSSSVHVTFLRGWFYCSEVFWVAFRLPVWLRVWLDCIEVPTDWSFL